MKLDSQWATLVVQKYRGGRSKVLNSSRRELFALGDTYYSHRLLGYPDGSRLNIVVRLSPKGRRMVQEIVVK